MATVNLGRIKFVWQGAYNGATAYVADDVVSYNGSSYICILASTGNLPTNATYWQQMSSAGTNGTNGTDVGTTITTQGDILYRDASGLARLGAGTSGQFLKTNGSGANPSWSTVSSDKVRLATTTVSSSVSSLEITTGFSDTYSIYELYWFNTTLSGSSVTVRLQFGYGGTPTYVTGDYNAFKLGIGVEDSTGVPSMLGGTNSSDGIPLSADWSVITSANRTFNGKMALFNLRATSTVDKYGATSNCVYKHSGSNYTVSSIAGGYAGNSTLRSNAVTAIKILTNTGTIDSGTFVLYGIKTA
jgi:hypothetical protein